MSSTLPPKPDPGPIEAGPIGAPSKDDCTMAMLAHLLGAFLNFPGPLIIWLIKKDQSPFVDDQGKEALNFQLTVLILHVACFMGVAATCGILFFLPFVPYLVQIIFGVLGAVEANKGVAYRYPLTIRMIK
jgi:uncharacterized Tic20 family protein